MIEIILDTYCKEILSIIRFDSKNPFQFNAILFDIDMQTESEKEQEIDRQTDRHISPHSLSLTQSNLNAK